MPVFWVGHAADALAETVRRPHGAQYADPRAGGDFSARPSWKRWMPSLMPRVPSRPPGRMSSATTCACAGRMAYTSHAGRAAQARLFRGSGPCAACRMTCSACARHPAGDHSSFRHTCPGCATTNLAPSLEPRTQLECPAGSISFGPVRPRRSARLQPVSPARQGTRSWSGPATVTATR